VVPLAVSALADRGAVHLGIPEHLGIQLSLSVDVYPDSPTIPLSVAK
jgi:hypothetical protein